MIEEFRFKRNVSMAIIAFATNVVLIFVSYRLIIGREGLEALGLWSTLTAWVFLLKIGDVGMGAATVRYVARCDSKKEPIRIRTYVDTGLIFNGVLYFVLAMLGYILLSKQF